MTIEHEDAGRWQRLQPRERALIIIVGIIAVLAIVYLLFISGGKGAPEALPSFTPAPGSSSLPSAAPTSVPTSAPQTFEIFEGKDPFRPLITTGGVLPATTGTATGGPGPTSSPGTSGAQRVTLIDISGSGSSRTATVDVDSTEYHVKAGETFAGSYRVKSLTSSCGTFVFGDETFTLCVGQEVLK